MYNKVFLREYEPILKATYASWIGSVLVLALCGIVEILPGKQVVPSGAPLAPWLWIVLLGVISGYLQNFLNFYLLDSVGEPVFDRIPSHIYSLPSAMLSARLHLLRLCLLLD